MSERSTPGIRQGTPPSSERGPSAPAPEAPGAGAVSERGPSAPGIPDSPLVTARMRERLGVWTPWGLPSPPISESDIRRWAIAVYWPEPPPRLYWDVAYANTTRWGGIVAPVEFNPFAWPTPNTGPARPSSASRSERRIRRVNGGSHVRFGVVMRPGDRIEARSRLERWRSREGRNGELLLVDFRHEWRNQRGEPVRDAVHTLIYR